MKLRRRALLSPWGPASSKCRGRYCIGRWIMAIICTTSQTKLKAYPIQVLMRSKRAVGYIASSLVRFVAAIRIGAACIITGLSKMLVLVQFQITSCAARCLHSNTRLPHLKSTWALLCSENQSSHNTYSISLPGTRASSQGFTITITL